MRILYERSGGFAGPATQRSHIVDTEALPPNEAKELQDLLKAADVSALPMQSASDDDARPDAFTYRLVIETEGRKHSVEVSDTHMPAALRPLIKWLNKHASPGRF